MRVPEVQLVCSTYPSCGFRLVLIFLATWGVIGGELTEPPTSM